MIPITAALANTGWVESLQVGTGAIYATEPRGGIELQEELVRIAMSEEEGLIDWRVVYDFRAQEAVQAPTAFPVDLELRRDEELRGSTHHALRTLFSLLDEPATWLALNEAWIRRHEEEAIAKQIAKLDPGYQPPRTLWDEVESRGAVRAGVPPGELAALGVQGFEVRIEGRLQPLEGDVVAELTTAADGVLRLRLNVPIPLDLQQGPNRVEIRWTTTGRTFTTRSNQGWRARYDFRPARTWGRIGRFTLAIEQALTRGGPTWTLPWNGPLPVGRFLVWRAEGWNPDLQLELEGRAPYLFGAPEGPVTEKHITGSWAPGGVPALPWTDASASSTDPGTDLWFYDWDGWLAKDFGLGPMNAVDGAARTAWCATEPVASLTIQLPEPAQGLRIRGGRRNRLRLAEPLGPPEPCPGLEVLDPEGAQPIGCIEVQTPEVTRVPHEVVVRAGDTSYPISLGPDGDGLIIGELHAGPVEIEVAHPEGACVGEVVPAFAVPPLLTPDLEPSGSR